MATSPKVLALIEKARATHAAALQAKQLAEQAKLDALSQITGRSPSAAGHSGYSERSSSPSASRADSVKPDLFSPELNILTEIARAAAATQTTTSQISLNAEQSKAVEMGLRGQSFALIGAAGTGKTTTTQELIRLVTRSSHMLPLTDSTKHLSKDAPGLVICGYTNRAVNNIKKKLPPHLQSHCITLHKLLEYAPSYFTVYDDEGNERNTMRFEPSRNGANTLPHISTVILEEASMIGTDLFGQLLDALPRPSATQFIFLGDIFQLPPVFGPSILGFKMSELPVVELTHVYRQALLSPIISGATAVRTDTFTSWITEQQQLAGIKADGKLTEKIIIDRAEHGKLTIHPWKKRIAAPAGVKTIVSMITNLINAGSYNPDEDQILCPFNKSFGTIELNKGIAEFLTTQRGGTTYEVIARFTRSYWAVDDKVLVDRHTAVITKIEQTIGYIGKPTRAASKTLDRSGYDPVIDGDKKQARSVDEVLNELDAIAEQDDEESKNLASHTITVWIEDLGEERKLSTAGEINAMLLSYCLTFHKSQGSEWKRVFLFLHSSHQMMISRELLYTGMTRAKDELYIICEGNLGGYDNQMHTGSRRAVIPGVTLQEKIEYFQDKAKSMKNIVE